MQWEAVIGLEIHVQLATKTKIFSGASTTFGVEPNTQACAIDLGMPGVLPVLNQEALRMALKFGLSIGAEIPKKSIFARKNYFYPDLPKGYQISQHTFPVVGKGAIEIITEDGCKKSIGITRAHLEEDAGKSLHEDFHGMSGIDLNRAGTPLLEIVSEPELNNAKDAVTYLKMIHTLVRYLEISDANMQEGSFRCDTNVSVRLKDATKLGTRAEIKNLNSFRYVEKAINYEIARQIALIENGDHVIQETRLYDADKDETRSMRSKEAAHDYRYFPEPDLLPVLVSDELLDSIKNTLPELPWQKYSRFKQEYELTDYDAEFLVTTKELADYFEMVVSNSNASAKLAANWITGELTARLHHDGKPIQEATVTATQLAALLNRISDNTISGKIAKTVFEAMWQGEGSADDIISKRGLKQITDTAAIEKIIDTIIAANPQQLEQYRAGKEKLLGFFVGQVMQVTQGKTNPQQLNTLLKQKLAGKPNSKAES